MIENRMSSVARLVSEAGNQGAQVVTLLAIIDEASEEGAARVLRRCGLHDEAAGDDIRELRTLLEAWREARSTVRRTVVHWLTTFFIVAMIAGVAMKLRIPFLEQ